MVGDLTQSNKYCFSRKELQDIKDKAKKYREGCTEDWSVAYGLFINAADHLDAMLARAEVKQ